MLSTGLHFASESTTSINKAGQAVGFTAVGIENTYLDG